MRSAREVYFTERLHRKALEIRERLVELEPENPQEPDALALALLKCAQIARLLGNDVDEQVNSSGALDAANRAVLVAPEDCDIVYNLACALARSQRAEDALGALARCVDLGYGEADWAAQDPDFESLRDRPEFLRLLERKREA